MRSAEHYCGEFANYRNQRDEYSRWHNEATTDADRLGAKEMLQKAGEGTLLDDVERAPSLTDAKILLEQMGFEPMNAPN